MFYSFPCTSCFCQMASDTPIQTHDLLSHLATHWKVLFFVVLNIALRMKETILELLYCNLFNTISVLETVTVQSCLIMLMITAWAMCSQKCSINVPYRFNNHWHAARRGGSLCVGVRADSPGLGLVQKVVYSGEGTGPWADPGHELDTLCGLTQSKHQRGLLRQVLRLWGAKDNIRVCTLANKACVTQTCTWENVQCVFIRRELTYTLPSVLLLWCWELLPPKNIVEKEK